MFEALSTPHNRKLTFLFLAAGCVFTVGAAIVTVSDNPPGILLSLLAAAAFILSLVHPWRTARQYGMLFTASLVGLFVFAVLHNVFEALGSAAGPTGLIQGVLEGLSVAAFLLAVMVCPPVILVGAVGWVITLIRNRRRTMGSPDTTA